MGNDEEITRNVWLRTADRFNDHSLGWLRETRSGYHNYFTDCLENEQPWVMNLLLDENEEDSEPWEHQYDPEHNFLFGKVGPGLPDTVWRGNWTFNSIENLHPIIKEKCE